MYGIQQYCWKILTAHLRSSPHLHVAFQNRGHNCQKGCLVLSQALTAVSDRVPDILAMGVPIPEHIAVDTFNVFADPREMDIYGKKKIAHFSLDMDLRKELHPVEEEVNDQDAPAPWEVTCALSTPLVIYPASSVSAFCSVNAHLCLC